MDGRLACGKLLDSHFRTFSHSRASFRDNGKTWPALFAAAHICMNELMLIDDD